MAAISGKPPLIVIPDVEGWQGWVVLGLVGFMLVALLAELAPPHLVMMGTLIICLSLSIIDLKAAFQGFSDQAMLSVAVLFVVAKGIEMSGGLEYLTSVLFKAPKKSKSMRPGSRPSRTEGSIVWVLLKFCVPVAIFSAFLANIPLVAMMIPPILEFANKVKMSPSKMLIPLSYAANLGGTMTLIGASTNLVVLSMAAQKLPNLHMSLFEIGVVGVPITFVGLFYIVAFSGKLLPNRVSTHSTTMAAREYNILLSIKENSKLAHKSIEWSGLGCQPGLHLVAITRDVETILDPAPELVLQPKDRLHFVGIIDSILLLTQVYGLKLTEDEGQGEVDLNQLKATQIVIEAVIASGSSMVHERIADLQCRTRFNSTVAAIHRHRKRLTSLIGEIRVEAGDCLLMVADTLDFVTKHRTNSHFALVSQLPGFKPLNRKRAFIASIFGLSMVVASGVGMNLLMCALLSSAGLLLTKCLTPQDAMEAIELPVIIMIAAAFGIAEAMVESGAATILAKALMGLAGKSMFGLISCTYVATTLFSLAITNSAAVTIMFPVALAAANHQALDFRPFAYTLMMAASAGFMTPTACPTNLMVYSPGSYKFSDYIHFGGPLQLLLLVVTVGVTMTLKYWYIWAIVIFAITCGTIPLIASHKSTHPTAVDDGVAARHARSEHGQHDDENPSAALNAGRELMLAPGHDNEETTTRRMSQTTIPPTASSSTTSFPSTFSSAFPPPHRLEDSHTSSSSSSSSSTGPNQTSRDFSSSSFPPPYRLDESPIPTFPSIRTSLSDKAAQFMYDPKPNLFESVAPSSSSAQITSVTTESVRAAVVPLGPQAAQPQSSQSSPATPIPQIMPLGATAAPQEPQTKLDIPPYRTRQPLVQAFSRPVPFSSPQSQPRRMSSETASSSSFAGVMKPLDGNVDFNLLQPLDGNVDSNFLQPLDGNADYDLLQPLGKNVDSNFFQPLDINVTSSFSQPLDINEDSNISQPMDINVATSFSQPLDINVASSFLQPLDGSFLQPLDDNVDSFTDVNISEENSSSSSIGPMFPDSNNSPVPSTSVGPLTGGETSETGPVGLLSKLLRPSFSALMSGGGEPKSQVTTSPSNTETATSSNTERPSVFEVGGSAQTSTRRASKRVSTYVRSPNRSSRKASRAVGRKKSKSPRSPRSGRGSPRASSRASAARIASSEDSVTGGISNLLSTRRLSSLNDTSAFADNTSVVDH